MQRTTSQSTENETARGEERRAENARCGSAQIVFAKERPEVLANQLPFERIDSYRIVKEIGRGGMATVFAVENDAGQIYALKLLHQGPQNNDKKWSVRFEREFRLLSKLRHPNLIAVHDYGQHGDYPYFVMDYIEGTDLWSFYQKQLRNHTTEGRIRLLLPLIAQIISALDYIHTHRVVHQDLKPANILLDAGFERVFLADFGLARELRHDISMVTHAGFLGTLGYAPPEIVERGRLDGRADLYSLGVILYICFADRRPIPVKGRALHEVAMAVLEEEPPPILSFCPDLPPIMAEAIHRCMQKDATQRYLNAKALWAALRPMYQDFFGEKVVPSVALSLPASVVPSVPVVGDWLPDMVGRDNERNEIERRIEALSQKHQGSLVLVSGSTGIGKSLFLEEMARQAYHQVEHVIHLAFRPHHAPFQSLAEFLLGLFPHLPSALQRDPCIQILGHYLPLLREHLDIPSMEMPPLRHPSEEIWGLLYPLLLDLFAEGPQVWFLDDLHHADPASLQILHKMLSFFLEETNLPLLMVGALSRQADAAFVLPASERVLRITLPPLSEQEEAALVAQLSGSWPRPEALLELRRFSEGVPLRTLELLLQGWWEQQAEHANGTSTQDNAAWGGGTQSESPTHARSADLSPLTQPLHLIPNPPQSEPTPPKQNAAPSTQPPLSEGTQVLQLSDLIFDEELALSSPAPTPPSPPPSDIEARRKLLTQTLTDDTSASLPVSIPRDSTKTTGIENTPKSNPIPSSVPPVASAPTALRMPLSRKASEKQTMLDLQSPFVPHPSVESGGRSYNSRKPHHTMEPSPWVAEQESHTQDGLSALSQAEEAELLSELNSDSTPHNLPRVTGHTTQAPIAKPASVKREVVLQAEYDTDSASSSDGLRGKTTQHDRDPDSTDRLPPHLLAERLPDPTTAPPSPSPFVAKYISPVPLPPLFFQPEEIEELELELEEEAAPHDMPSGGLGAQQRDMPSGGLGAQQRDMPSGGLSAPRDMPSGGAISHASPVGQALLTRAQQRTTEAAQSEQTMVMSNMPMLEALRAEMAWRESTQQDTAQELLLDEERDEEGDETGVSAVSPYASAASSPSPVSRSQGISLNPQQHNPTPDTEGGFADTSEQPFPPSIGRQPFSPSLGGTNTLSSSDLAIRPLWESRLAMLPPHLVFPMRGCAFLIEPFSVDEIQSVCALERAGTLDLINQFLRLRFFQLRTWGDDERYAFSFPMLRDLARSALSAEEQATFALRAAQSMLKHRSYRELVAIAPMVAALCSQGGEPKEAFYWQFKAIEYAIQLRLPDALDESLRVLREMLVHWAALGEQELLLNMLPSLMQEHDPQLETEWTSLVYYLLWMGCLYALRLEEQWKHLQKGLHNALRACGIHSREGWHQAAEGLSILQPALRFSGLPWFSEDTGT